MSFLTCMVLALLYSSGVQLIRNVYEEYDDDYKLPRELSLYRDSIREKRSNDPNCPQGEEARIANGYDAEQNEFPFIVALIRRQDNPRVSDQYCVGTLLTFDVVVTACHCLVIGDKIRIRFPHKLINPETVDVSAGTVDLQNYVTRRKKGIAKFGQIGKGKTAAVHPKCSRSKNKITHDFGLLQLEKPFKIQPVFVPSQVDTFNFSRTYDPKYSAQVDEMTENHTACTTMGWGLDVAGESPNILQVIDTTMRPGNWCKEKIENITAHQETGPDMFAKKSQICVVGCETGQTVCAGDSGGPLVCDKQFIGVVSYGPGEDSCGKDGTPFVYARTDANHLWIWATIATFSENDTEEHSKADFPASQMTTMAVVSAILVIKDALLYYVIN